MKEEEMDRMLRDAARETYHAPPEPPRDELWASIRAARLAQRGPGRNGSGKPGDVAPTPPATPDPDVIPLPTRLWKRWGWRALPIAALLLLSFGLGRLSLRYRLPSSPRPVATTTPPATTSPAVSAPTAGVPAPAAPGPTLAVARPAEPAARAVPVSRSPGAVAAPATNGRASASVYRFAAAQTLGQAELLLTSFRAETRARGTVDPQVAEWAGDVLASTRLLLDSPAGRDPKTRALLEDVELVLAQIVQLRAEPAGTARGDADLIDHALQQRDLLPRLRTAMPAGAPVGT